LAEAGFSIYSVGLFFALPGGAPRALLDYFLSRTLCTGSSSSDSSFFSSSAASSLELSGFGLGLARFDVFFSFLSFFFFFFLSSEESES